VNGDVGYKEVEAEVFGIVRVVDDSPMRILLLFDGIHTSRKYRSNVVRMETDLRIWTVPSFLLVRLILYHRFS